MSKKKIIPAMEQKRIRNSFDDAFKVKVVLETLKETMTGLIPNGITPEMRV